MSIAPEDYEETADEPAPPAPELDAAEVARAEAYRSRTRIAPTVTMWLCAVIVIVFAAEQLLGGTELVPVLHALGGLSRDAVLRGEVWRLVSCSFLHAGLLHVAMNLWVLFVIGAPVEQMVGSPRFLILYTASTLGAGLMCLATSDAIVTVGASGGIFGLLAAESVFVFTSRSLLLPPDMRARRRRAAVTNLILNAGVSLRANVSLSAHLGGAIVGAVLMLTGFAPSEIDTHARAPLWARALAAASVAILGVSLVCGLALSGIGGVVAAPRLERTTLAGLGWSAEVPSALAAHDATPPDAQGILERVFGDVQPGPALLAIARIPRDEASSPESDEAQLVAIEAALGTPPEGATIDRVRRVRSGDHGAVVARYAFANGLFLERYFVVRDGEIARVEVASWSAFEGQYGPLAARVAASITSSRSSPGR